MASYFNIRRSLSSSDYMENLRKANRKRYNDRRQQSLHSILKRKRIKFTEVEESLEDISVEEVRELALSIKRLKPCAETLRRIARGVCGGKDHITAFLSIYGALNVVISCLSGNNGERQLEAAAILTNLACGCHKTTQKIADLAGASLISHMSYSNRFAQEPTTNLVCGCHKTTRKIADHAGASLVSHMSYSNRFTQGQCAWAAGNIVEDCEACFNVLKSQGLLPAIQSLLESPLPDVLSSAVFCLNACLAYFEENAVIDFVQLDLMESLVKLMQQSSPEDNLIADACTALSRCCFIAATHQKDILNETFADALLKSLDNVLNPDNNDIFVATPLMRCLGYTCFASNAACRYVASYQPFQFLVEEIMATHFYHLKKELVWVLTNILASRDILLPDVVLTPVIKKMAIFLSPLDSAVLQALYFLCVLVQKGYKKLLLSNGVSEQVVLLHLTCNKKNIETASDVFLKLLKSE